MTIEERIRAAQGVSSWQQSAQARTNPASIQQRIEAARAGGTPRPKPLVPKLPTYRSTLDGMADGAMPLSQFARKKLDDARLSPVRTNGLTAERDRLDAKLTQSQNRINAGEGADVDGMKRDQYRINDLSRQLDTQKAERYEAGLAGKRAAMERKAGPVSGAKLSPDRRTEDLLQTYPGYGPAPRDKSGVTDAARYLSDPEFRKAAKGRMKLDSTLDDALAPLDYMTETERNTLVSYVQAGDLQSAEQYKALLDRTLNARRQQKQSATMERTAREHPVLGTVNNLGSSLGSGFALAGTAGQAVKNLVTGKDEPTDYNSKWFKSAHAVNDTAKGLHQAAYDAAGGGTWGEIAAGAADMGLSLGQMVAKMPLGPAALPMMALTAGGQSSLGALERGASTGQALAYGTATGLVEALTEKLPLDALFDLAKTGKSGVKAVLGSVLKQMGSEASQEMVSELADNLADKAIMGTRSEYENYVAGLVSQGMDEGRARQAATKQYYLYNVAKAGLGGAVTGGVMAGGANIIGSIGNKNAQAPLKPNRLLTGKEQFEQSQVQNGQKNTAPVVETDTVVDTKHTGHTQPEINVIEAYKNAAEPRILSFIAKTNQMPDGQKSKIKLTLSTVSERLAREVERLTGASVSGGVSKVNGGGITHVEVRHGENGTQDSSMRNPEDIARMNYVIQNFDSVDLLRKQNGEVELSDEFRNSDNTPAKMIKLSKKIDGTYYIVEAVPETKTKTMWVVSAYIENGGNGQVLNVPKNDPQLTSETPHDTNAPIPDPTLPQGQSDVNTEGMQNGRKDAGINAKATDGNIAPLQVNSVDNAQNTAYNKRNGGVLDAGSEYGAENAGDRVPGVPRNLGADAGRGTDGRGNPGISGLELGPKNGTRETLDRQGVVNLGLQDSSSDSALFSASLGSAKKRNPFGAFVDGQDAETLRKDGTRTFLSADHMAGVAVKQDGDIVGVFNSVKRPNGHAVVDLLTTAIANGGTKLDCYGMNLGKMYAQCGFIPVARMDFNPEYAPADWKPEFGTPDVIFWRHNGDSVETVASRLWKYPVYSAEDIQKLPTFTDYDQAGAYRDMMQGGTVGPAKSGFDQYSHLQNQTDKFHPDGEEPRVRQVDVPTKGADGRSISKSAATTMEAGVIPDEMVGEIQQMIVDGKFSYHINGDNGAIRRAEALVKEKRWDGAMEYFHGEAQRGVVSKDLMALGATLLNNAAQNGDSDALVRILTDYASMSRAGAQATQANRLLKKLSPQGQLYGITRSVQNLQGELNKRMGDKAPTLAMDQTIMDGFLNATDQAGRDKAMLDIRQSIADQVPATWMDKWNAWRYMAMLANPRTIIRNFFGNVGFQPVRMLKDRVGAAIEAGVNKMGGKIERTKSFAYSPELYRATWGDYAVSKDLLEQGSRYHDNQGEIEKLKPIFNKGIPTKALEKVTGKTFHSGIMENIRKGNSWLLEATDAFFKRMTYADALAGSLRAHGVTAADMAAGTVDAGLLDRARAYATQEALKATYQDRNAVSDIAATFGRGSKTIPGKALSTLSEGVLPFRRTPANILVRGAEYSPLGLAKSLTYDLYKVKKGDMTAAEAIDGIASGLTGSALVGLGAFLFSIGLVSSGGGDDKKEDAMRDITGGQDYALQLPGGGSVTLDWLAPEALPFFMGVEFADSIGQNGLSAQNFGDTLGAVADPMLEMSMLQSLNDALDSISYSDNKLQALVSSALVSYLGQAVPTIGGQIERTAEDKRMTTYTDKNNKWLSTDMQYAIGRSSARVPGRDFQQIPFIDAWGRTESTGSLGARAANNFLNPAFVSKSNVTAVDSEVLRLYRKIGAGEVVPDRAPKYLTISGEKIDLDKNQYLQYAKERGSASLETANLMIGSTVYKGLTDQGKASAISGSYEYADAIAKKNLGLDYLPDEWVLEAEKLKPEKRVNFLLARQVLSDVGSGEGATDRKRNALISMKNMTAEEKAATGMALGIDTRKLDYSSAEALAISTMPESTREKAKAAKKARISDKVFIAAYEAQKGVESDKDRNGATIPNSESMNKKNAIDRAAKSLTFEQRKVLYDLFGVSKKVQMYAPR